MPSVGFLPSAGMTMDPKASVGAASSLLAVCPFSTQGSYYVVVSQNKGAPIYGDPPKTYP